MSISETLKMIFKSNKKYAEEDVFVICDEVYSSLYNCSIFKIKEYKSEYIVEFLNHEIYDSDKLYDYYEEIYNYLSEIIDNNKYVPESRPHVLDYDRDYVLELDEIRYIARLTLQGYLVELDLYRFIGIDDVVEVVDDEKNIWIWKNR